MRLKDIYFPISSCECHHFLRSFVVGRLLQKFLPPRRAYPYFPCRRLRTTTPAAHEYEDPSIRTPRLPYEKQSTPVLNPDESANSRTTRIRSASAPSFVYAPFRSLPTTTYTSTKAWDTSDVDTQGGSPHRPMLSSED